MPLVCKFLSVSGLLVAVVGLAGCYDLSDPDGPRREDFVRANDATEQTEQQQGQSQTELVPAAAPEVTSLLAQSQPKRVIAADRKVRDWAGDRTDGD